MSKVQRRTRAIFGAACAVPLLLTLGAGATAAPPTDQPELEVRSKEIISQDGLQFRDLNGNKTVDVYEDWREPVGDRVADLVEQMTLEEKAGLMLIDTLNAACEDGVRGTVPASGENYINEQHMHRFIFRNTVAGAELASCGEAEGGFSGSSVFGVRSRVFSPAW